jgi:DNA-binding transcriptional regulator GbsR (MarR family)
MKSRHESKKDHVLRTPLEATLSRVVDDKELVKQLAEEVLQSLDEQNIISYNPRFSTNIVTPFGRMLLLLMERPNLTIREMSVILGVTESNINKAVTKLLSDELVFKKQNNGRYEYSVNYEIAKEHQDIRQLVRFIALLSFEK